MTIGGSPQGALLRQPGKEEASVVYLMIIIVAAIAGITRLAMQQRREQKMHLLDDFRSSLERLSSQPLPAQGRASSGGSRKAFNGRLPFNHKKRPESPRGEWERIAPPADDIFSPAPARSAEPSDDFFGHSAQFEQTPAPAPARDDFFQDEIYEEDRPRRKTRKQREPLLAGRLWAKPREPWLWTYEKKKPRSSQAARRRSEIEYVDFASENELVYAAEGNLARSGYGPRSPQRNFAGPSGSASRGGLEPARRDAAKRRLEVRRHTGSRLS